jgi:uncharacterized membrane protein (UPF0136 family)
VPVALVVAGLLVIGGGFIGYRKGSVESLVVAGSAGALWLVAAAGMARGAAWARALAATVAVALVGLMGWRWASGASPAAALPPIAVSVAILALLAAARRRAP